LLRKWVEHVDAEHPVNIVERGACRQHTQACHPHRSAQSAYDD
jgi:hypothetical protein